MITEEDVKYIANLSRLYLADNEISRIQREISSILQYIEKLKEVSVSGIEPIGHILLIENITRKDISKASRGEEAERLLSLAPHREGSRIKVKSILK